MFISDQILLKLKCDLDDYLYFPCVGTKHIKANGKRVLEALIQRFFLHVIPSIFLNLQSMKTICCCYVRQPMCLLMLFCNSKIHFHHYGPFRLMKTMLNSLNVFVRFISSVESLSKG